MAPTTRPVLHLSALPDERARVAPDAPCVDDDRLELTNAEFARRVRAVAADFRSLGIGPGDVVAVMLSNRVELIVAMFAAWRIGAALTPINPSLTAAEAGYQIVDSGARLLVADGHPIDAPGVVVLDVGDLSTAPSTATTTPMSIPPPSPCSSTRAARRAHPRASCWITPTCRR